MISRNLCPWVFVCTRSLRGQLRLREKCANFTSATCGSTRTPYRSWLTSWATYMWWVSNKILFWFMNLWLFTWYQLIITYTLNDSGPECRSMMWEHHKQWFPFPGSFIITITILLLFFTFQYTYVFSCALALSFPRKSPIICILFPIFLVSPFFSPSTRLCSKNSFWNINLMQFLLLFMILLSRLLSSPSLLNTSLFMTSGTTFQNSPDSFYRPFLESMSLIHTELCSRDNFISLFSDSVWGIRFLTWSSRAVFIFDKYLKWFNIL